MIELRAGGYEGQFVSAEGGPQAPLPALAHGAAEGAWLLYPGRPVATRTVYAAEAADAARVLLAGAGDVDGDPNEHGRRRDGDDPVHADRRATTGRRSAATASSTARRV